MVYCVSVMQDKRADEPGYAATLVRDFIRSSNRVRDTRQPSLTLPEVQTPPSPVSSSTLTFTLKLTLASLPFLFYRVFLQIHFHFFLSFLFLPVSFPPWSLLHSYLYSFSPSGSLCPCFCTVPFCLVLTPNSFSSFHFFLSFPVSFPVSFPPSLSLFPPPLLTSFRLTHYSLCNMFNCESLSSLSPVCELPVLKEEQCVE